MIEIYFKKLLFEIIYRAEKKWRINKKDSENRKKEIKKETILLKRL
jgi:hypothetical protein